jgi:hypothetical protein
MNMTRNSKRKGCMKKHTKKDISVRIRHDYENVKKEYA